MSFLEKMVIVTGVVFTIASCLQAWRIFSARSSEDISLWSSGIFAIGMTAWLLYGVADAHRMIIAAFFFGAMVSWLVFGLTLAYRKDDGDIANENIG